MNAPTPPAPVETRSLDLELRAVGDDEHPRRLKGTAIIYDAEADLGEFIERIKPGAITQTLRSKRDIKARFEHNQLLGRQENGTLRLTETSRGLDVEIDVAETRAGDDALALVRRGDIRGMSFGMAVRSQKFTRENGKLYRDIEVLDLHEITVTDRPAYEATTISQRSVDPAAIEEAKRLAARVADPTQFGRRIRLLEAA